MHLLTYFVISCLLSSISCTLKPGSDERDHSDEAAVNLRRYQTLFQVKRKDHWGALEQIQGYDKEKRDRIIYAMVDGMVNEFKDANFLIQSAKFVPGSPFPDETKPDLKEAVSKTLENTAFFADLALHFPNTIAKMYKRDANFKNLMEWAITFSDKTDFYDEKTKQLMHLVSQELGLVQKDPTFSNPYASPSGPDMSAMIDELEKLRLLKIEKEKKAKKEEKRKKQRGPRLQGGRSEL